MGAICAVAMRPTPLHDEHDVEEPEDRDRSIRKACSPRSECVSRIAGFGVSPACGARNRRDSNTIMNPLPHPEAQERGLIAVASIISRMGMTVAAVQRESRRSQTSGEASQIGKPFERIAHAGAVDRAGTNAGQSRGDNKFQSELANEFRTTAAATKTPPKGTTTLGPKRSTNQPRLAQATSPSR